MNNVRIKGAALAASAMLGILHAAVARRRRPTRTISSTSPTSSHVMGLGGNNICVIEDDVSLADQNPALIGPGTRYAGRNVNYMYYMGGSAILLVLSVTAWLPVIMAPGPWD